MSAKLTTAQDDVSSNGDLTRYCALLKISGTVGAQPTVDAVLHRLATLLSNVVSFDNIALLLFDPSSQRLACVPSSGVTTIPRSRSVQKSCMLVRGSARA